MEKFKEGKGLLKGFEVRSKSNHWLDCVAANCAVAALGGMRVASPMGKIDRPRQWVQSGAIDMGTEAAAAAVGGQQSEERRGGFVRRSGGVRRR